MSNDLLKEFYDPVTDNDQKPKHLFAQASSLGVQYCFCSSYIESEKALVQGEYVNPTSKDRKALIILTDPSTMQIKGTEIYIV